MEFVKLQDCGYHGRWQVAVESIRAGWFYFGAGTRDEAERAALDYIARAPEYRIREF